MDEARRLVTEGQGRGRHYAFGANVNNALDHSQAREHARTS